MRWQRLEQEHRTLRVPGVARVFDRNVDLSLSRGMHKNRGLGNTACSPHNNACFPMPMFPALTPALMIPGEQD